jgi:predicted molibdopterin-dependent oxidoreductase YjgC
MRAVVGTNNIDNYNRLEHSPTLVGFSKTLGLVTANNSLDRISSSDLILVLGSNPTSSHPIISLKIKGALKNAHSKLIVFSPRKINLAEKADQWLQLKPGSYLALLGGIMHIIVNDSLADDQFIKDNTQEFEAFKQSLDQYQPNRVAEITGVPKKELIRAARLIAKAKSLAGLYSAGLTQHDHGTQNVIALADLFILTGHAGREQSGIYPMRYDSNSQGVCDMGVLPDYLPGYQRVDEDRIREKFEQAWGVKLPSAPGLDIVQMFDAIKKGKLKALYIMGYNPIRDYPHGRNLQQVLSSLDFLVVQDLFLSPTARLAEIVLPATSFAEREGTITSMERRVQRISPAITSLGDAAPDWKIIYHLSNIMGYSMDYSSEAEIMEEINSLVPIYGGITYQRLEDGGLFWPCPDKEHPGTKFLQPHWENPENKASFAPLPAVPELEKVDQEYPYKLIIGGTLFHSGGGTLSMRSKILKNLCPTGYVNINPQDAASLGISEDDTVLISSQQGSIEAKARMTLQNPPGIVFMPKEFEELDVQELIPERFDPVSGIPAMKVCAVNLSKV